LDAATRAVPLLPSALVSTTGEATGEGADEAADWDDGDEVDWLLPQALSAPEINRSATGRTM